MCIRWDLTSSPWMCCPHSSGVTYGWRGGKLHPALPNYPTADAATRATLAAHRAASGARMRLASHDVCHEGAFFHAGLKPRGASTAPACGNGTWALLDEIGRFNGFLEVLHEECAVAPPAAATPDAATSTVSTPLPRLLATVRTQPAVL